MKTQQYIDGWNYRCSYVAGGKYKLPRYCEKNREFLTGFEDCNALYVIAISNSIQTLEAPIYPKPL